MSIIWAERGKKLHLSAFASERNVSREMQYFCESMQMFSERMQSFLGECNTFAREFKSIEI